MFELQDAVTIDGRSYRIRTDFRVILEIFVMLQDPELDDGDRTESTTPTGHFSGCIKHRSSRKT